MVGTPADAVRTRSGVAVTVDFSRGAASAAVVRPETSHPRVSIAEDAPTGRIVVCLGNVAALPKMTGSLLAGEERPLREMPAISAAIVWDPHTERLTVATDRVGNLGLYYRQADGRLVVASTAELVAAQWPRPAEFDVEAASEILWMGFLVSDHTLFRHVRRVPTASIWQFGRHAAAKSTYWEPSFRPGPDDTVERALDTFGAAVSRSTSGSRTAIALSGGIDTRAIFATVLKLGRKTDGFTSGLAGSADVRVARRLARHLDGEWHNASVAGEFLDRFQHWAETAVRDSDGTLGVEHAHLAYLNSLLPGWMDTLVDGGGAEAAKRGLLRRAARAVGSNAELKRMLMCEFGKPEAAGALLGEVEMRRVEERLSSLLEDQLAGVAHSSTGDTLDAFFLRHMWSGYHGTGVAMQNQHVGCRLPFLENDFLDALMEVPLGVRERSAVNFLAVRRNAPQLERYPRVWMDIEVPWSNSALLQMTPTLVVKVASRFLQRPAFPIARWMTRDLQAQARAALESFLGRGVADGRALRRALAGGQMPVTGSLGRAARLAWRFDTWFRVFGGV